MGLGSRALFKRAQEQPFFIQAMNGLSDGSLVPVPGGVLIKRSEEHTSELQSHHELVFRLLLEKKNYISIAARAALAIQKVFRHLLLKKVYFVLFISQFLESSSLPVKTRSLV